VDLSGITSHLSDNPALALGLLFVGGVLTSLTPCIYPMIPITAAIVGGSQAGVAPGTRRFRPIALALVYALGLSLVYASLGLFAGLSGTLFGTVSSNPWLYFAMANMLILAALSMLDVFPIRMPSWILNRATAAGTGGTYSGALVMGDDDEERRDGVRLPVRVLAGHVHATGRDRRVVGISGAPAASGVVDGVDQAVLRLGDDRCR
jgi:thiol:disulfide interchange protein